MELGAHVHADHGSEESERGIFCVVDEYRWNAALDGRRAGWRRVLCDVAVLCRASLGQWQRDLRLQGGGGQVSARHAASSGAERDGAVPDSSGRPPFVPPNHPWPSPNETAREKAAAKAAAEAAAKGEPAPKPPVFPRPRGPFTETIGPMVNDEHTMILFVPNVQNQTTDPSYHLPAFYELWARWGPPEDRAFWAKAAEVSREFFAKVTGPQTALTPDRANFDATPAMGWDGKPVQYSYDSWRSVSNWSVDSSWWNKSKDEPVLSERYQKFLVGQGIHTFV